MKNRDEPLNLTGTVILAIVSLFVALVLLLAAAWEAIMWPIDKIERWHRNWYMKTTESARRHLEHEARRFGGRIDWE
jgi:hypothetical protein